MRLSDFGFERAIHISSLHIVLESTVPNSSQPRHGLDTQTTQADGDSALQVVVIFWMLLSV